MHKPQKFSPYQGIPTASKLASKLRKEIAILSTELHKIEDEEAVAKFKDLEGKCFSILTDPNTWQDVPNTTTYYKFGKYNTQSKTFETQAAVLTSDGKLKKAYPHQWSLHYLSTYFAEMKEVSAIDWQFIMRDALEQFVASTKKDLGLVEEKDFSTMVKV